ncbi:hypothetical protein LCGC14_1352940, partial [marine sediment metagenome]
MYFVSDKSTEVAKTSYLKLILATIVNLERIANNEKFVSFHNSLGNFARSLNLD